MDLQTSETKYVISLDAIDLNYISTLSKYKSPGVTEIWTKNNLTRDNEYYEFEIKEVVADEDGENSNQYLHTPCYICNSDIPNVFYKDHVNSKKHKTFQKIINLSLDRMKKVITNDNVTFDKNLNKAIYFCASCMVVVETNKRVSHENSPGHRNSLAVDKILNEFLDLYTDNKDTKQANEEKILPNNEIKVIGNNNQHADESLKDIEFLKKSKNFKDVMTLEHKNMELKTNCGVKVLIPEEHFHSIRKKSRKLYDCFLCATTFKLKFKSDHLHEDEHVKKITMPFADEHCVRQIDTSWTHCGICNSKIHIQHLPEHKMDVIHKLYLSEALYLYNGYITLQTQKLNDFDKFTMETQNGLNVLQCNEKNILNLEKGACTSIDENDKTLKRSNSETRVNNDNTSHDQSTSKIMEPIPNNPIHVQSVTFSKEQAGLLPVSNENATIAQVIKPENYTISKEQASQLPVSNKNANIAPVIKPENDTKPLTMIPLSQVAVNREGTFISAGYFYCAICNKCISNDNYNIYVHLTSSLHVKSVITMATEDLVYLHYHMDLSNYPAITCLVCNKKLPINNSPNITGHISGKTHIQKYNEMLSNNKIVHVNNREYFCNVCQIQLHPMHELVHCLTKKHLDKLPPTRNVTPSETSDTSSTSTGSINHEYLTLRPYTLKNLSNPNQRHCLVCDCKVPNNNNNIKSHLTGSYHNNQYKIILMHNKIRPEGNNFKCELCDVMLPSGGEIQHIETEHHRANTLPKVTKNMPSSSINNISLEKLNLRTYLLQDLDATNKLCITCNVKVPNNMNNIKSHLTGRPHDDQYKTMLCENKIRPDGNNFKCELCDVVLPSGGEIQHIKTKFHYIKTILKVTKTIPSSSSNIGQENRTLQTYVLQDLDANIKLCLVCNVKVPNNINNIKSHLTGRPHDDQYKTMLCENEIRREGNNFKCKLCDVIISSGGEIQHIKTEPHSFAIAIVKHCVLC